MYMLTYIVDPLLDRDKQLTSRFFLFYFILFWYFLVTYDLSSVLPPLTGKVRQVFFCPGIGGRHHP